MEQLVVGDSSSPDPVALLDIDNAPTSSYREAHKLSTDRCIETLVHACHCLNPNCEILSCPKMKRAISHLRLCRRKIKGDCSACNQLIAICCYHAEHCRVTKCTVSFCSSIKQKINFVPESTEIKGWGRALPVGHRDYYAHKLAVALAPRSFEGSGHDGAVTYDAKMIEKDVFEKSSSRREYNFLMSEKIDNAEKTVNEKKKQQAVKLKPVPQETQILNEIQQEALEQLMATMRTPTTLNQELLFLRILNNNPPIMKAFMKRRQAMLPGTSYAFETTENDF